MFCGDNGCATFTIFDLPKAFFGEFWGSVITFGIFILILFLIVKIKTKWLRIVLGVPLIIFVLLWLSQFLPFH